jgi:hypothetical protein
VWPQAAAPDIGSIGLVVGRDAGGPLAAFGIIGETGRA